MERNHPELSQEQKEQLYKAFKENEEILKGFLEDYKRNPEAWDVMSDENRLRGFLTTITASDIEECFNDMTIPDDVLDAFRDGSIEKKMETINSFSMGMVAKSTSRRRHTKKTSEKPCNSLISRLQIWHELTSGRKRLPATAHKYRRAKVSKRKIIFFRRRNATSQRG